MSLMFMLLSARWEDNAALVLWPLNLDVSIPAEDNTDLHHLEIVSFLTGPCGFTWLKSNCLLSFLKGVIRFRYSCRWEIIHNLSVGWATIERGGIWVPIRVCFTLSVIWKMHLSVVSSMLSVVKYWIVWHLCPLRRLRRNVSFNVSYLKLSSGAAGLPRR